MSNSTWSAGPEIRDRRIELGIGINDLADQVGLKPGSLRSIECGVKPSIWVIRRLADRLGLDEGRLLDAAGKRGLVCTMQRPSVVALLQTITDLAMDNAGVMELIRHAKAMSLVAAPPTSRRDERRSRNGAELR